MLACESQIVMPYCKRGSLFSFLQKGLQFTECELMEIASYCLIGLDYLHSQDITHGVRLYTVVDGLESQAGQPLPH